MSITKRILFGAAASWFSRASTIVLGLVLMPILFRHLPKEELGIWLLLGQSWAAMGILDLGFGPTLTRRIALTKGKSGSDPNSLLSSESLTEIADLVASGQRIYRFMALGVFIVSWALGFFYLQHLELHELDRSTVWAAWTILCACQALTVWATVWNCLLQGVGYVGWDAIITSVVSALMLIGQIVAVLVGGRLIALAVIAASSALFQRGIIRWFAKKQRPELFSLNGEWNPKVLKGMRGLAFRAWLTGLGTVLVFNTDGMFIASATSSDQIPAYRAAFLVVLNLHMLACVFGLSSSVFVSHLWQAGELSEVQRIVERNLRLGLSIMLSGGAAILAAGPSLFDVWLRPGNYAGSGVLAIFVVLFVLEQQTFVISTASRATEHEAFAGWLMAGGFLKIGLAPVLLKFCGLRGLALGTLIAQLLTAHWFVPWCGLRRLRYGLRRYMSSVALPAIVVLVSAVTLCFGTVKFLGGAQSWQRLGASSVAGCAVLAASLWLLVLDHHQRERILKKLGLGRVSSSSPSK